MLFYSIREVATEQSDATLEFSSTSTHQAYDKERWTMKGVVFKALISAAAVIGAIGIAALVASYCLVETHSADLSGHRYFNEDGGEVSYSGLPSGEYVPVESFDPADGYYIDLYAIRNGERVQRFDYTVPDEDGRLVAYYIALIAFGCSAEILWALWCFSRFTARRSVLKTFNDVAS